MTALTEDRRTPQRAGDLVADPLASGVTIHAGSMYVLNSSGAAKPAAATDTGPVRAVARRRAAAADGDTLTDGVLGVFRFGNSDSTDEIKRADIGSACYVVDDQTVAKTDGGASRPQAGTVFDVDDAGVWVRIGA